MFGRPLKGEHIRRALQSATWTGVQGLDRHDSALTLLEGLGAYGPPRLSKFSTASGRK